MAIPNQRRFWASGILTAVLLLGAATGTALVREVGAQGTPTITVVSPQPGETVTSDDIDVQVEVSDFTVDCAKAGRPNEDGVGHIHLMIDGMSMAQLANFYCGDSFTVPGDGLAPGKHTLIIDLATNDHLDMMETAQEVEITYEPANPVALPEAQDLGPPGVELVSPTDGATAPPQFMIEVKPVNFEATEELEGKQNVPGYGHWHVFVDTPMGAMMMDDMAMAGTPGAEEHRGTPAAEGEEVTIQRGETITWINASPIPHTTTGDPAKNPVKETRPELAQLPPRARAAPARGRGVGLRPSQ